MVAGSNPAQGAKSLIRHRSPASADACLPHPKLASIFSTLLNLETDENDLDQATRANDAALGRPGRPHARRWQRGADETETQNRLIKREKPASKGGLFFLCARCRHHRRQRRVIGVYGVGVDHGLPPHLISFDDAGLDQLIQLGALAADSLDRGLHRYQPQFFLSHWSRFPNIPVCSFSDPAGPLLSTPDSPSIGEHQRALTLE